MVAEINCQDVWREISNYVEGGVGQELRDRMEAHFRACTNCAAVLDGTRNVVRLVGDGRAFEIPGGFSERLYSKLRLSEKKPASNVSHEDRQTDRIPLGITPDQVPLGSHLLYFWESDADFARGVRFLEQGLRGDDHCIAFGHAEANLKVLEILREMGFDPDRLQADGRLTVILREFSASATLANIAAVLQAARRRGFPVTRYLGNLGVGRDPLPAGEDDVLELEARVTSLITQFPCVVICMYDVRALPGRLILKGGLETHPVNICGDHLHDNPYYVPEEQFLASLRHVH
jgi:hypothetical protein